MAFARVWWYNIKRNFLTVTFPVITFSAIYFDYTRTLNWKKTQIKKE